MQSWAWYFRRFRSMSSGEVLWRIRGKLQQAVDRRLLRLRQRPVAWRKIATSADVPWAVRPEVVGTHLPAVGTGLDWLPQGVQWAPALLARARRILNHRLTLFDLEDHDLGPEIDWNYEYKAQRKTPLIAASRIDYRDYAETGDCKFVWEPSRHYHLVTLGRAYRVSGERAFAEAVLAHLESWMDQCPYGLGMNWRSPLELAIRMINWVWALELIRPSGLITPQRGRRILESVYRHLGDISRNYSRFSSANNHLIGEAAGVYIAASYFAGLSDAARWKAASRQILLGEIARQTYADGGNREQAFGYHLFVLEFFLLAGLAARNQGEDFPAEYWGHLEKMFEFLCGLVEGGDDPPMFGDADDGYVLDLGNGRAAPRELLAVGAALFGRGDFKSEAGTCSEPAGWLLGAPGYERHASVAIRPEDQRIGPRAFPSTGYYVLQTGERGSANRVSVVFDCAELGLGAIAAHGHADALAFTLRAFGRDILVDAGTYDYFTYGPWRQYFRSTRAHNTVVVDGRDQSETLGLFLWGRRALARCTQWEIADRGASVVGEHDGYAQLAGGGVLHRRAVSLDRAGRLITVHDELAGTGHHLAEWYFHLAEGCSVRRANEHEFVILAGAGQIKLELPPELAVTLLEGSEDPIGGWVSRGYHRKTKSITVVASGGWQDRMIAVTRLQIELGI